MTSRTCSRDHGSLLCDSARATAESNLAGRELDGLGTLDMARYDATLDAVTSAFVNSQEISRRRLRDAVAAVTT